MWLHRRYDREYNNAIIGMTENWNHVLASRIFSLPDDENSDSTITKDKEDSMIASIAKEINEKEEEKKKTKKKIKKDIPFIMTTSKKIMQLKGQGATYKAVKESLKKGPKGDKKEKKSKPPVE